MLPMLETAVLNDHTDLFLLFNYSLPFLLWAANTKYSTHLDAMGYMILNKQCD